MRNPLLRGPGLVRSVIAVVCGMLGTATHTASAQSLRSPPLDELFRTFLAQEHVPSLSVAVARDGRVVWHQAYGYADVAARVPADSLTLYRIGSISKTITAVAALRAMDAGLLELDAPVQRYVPAFPTKPFPLTLRRLLTGTSGLRGYVGDEYLRDYHFPSMGASLSVFRDDTLAYEPGTSYVETPYGFVLLGVVLESVTRVPYASYVAEQVLRPARMTATRADRVAPTIPRRAHLYTRDSTGRLSLSAPLDLSYRVPSGGWLATASDVAQFGIALMDGTWLSVAANAAMRSPLQFNNGTSLPLGMGLALGTVGGRLPGTDDAVWTSGLVQGGTAVLLMYPKDRLAVAILMNINGEGGMEGFRLLTRTTFLAESTIVRVRNDAPKP